MLELRRHYHGYSINCLYIIPFDYLQLERKLTYNVRPVVLR
jgi:hypothetical protein